MRRRGVDDAGAGVHGDVIGEHAQDFAVEKWMLKIETFKFASRKVGQFADVEEAAFCDRMFCQLRCDDVNFAAGCKRHVLFIRMEGDRHGRRKSPWRGGPDNRGNFLCRERGVDSGGIVQQSVLHPDG